MYLSRKKQHHQQQQAKHKQQYILNNKMNCWHLHVVVVVLIISLQQICAIDGDGNQESNWKYSLMGGTVKPPGAMEPNIVELVIGGNATITCRLSDANSSQIWFYENRTGRNITQPSPLIQVLDNYTAVLLIINAEEQISEYFCKVKDQAIGITKVSVGTPPENVSDFKCRVYGYEFMECHFSKPKNMLLTEYQLVYHFKNETKEENCPLCPLNDGFSCNITQDYLPTRNEYIFKLTARNKGGANVQEFIIHNHKIVIPSQLIVNITNITSDSVSLEWYNKDYAVTDGSYRKNLKYIIQLYENRTELYNCQNITLDSKKFALINGLYAYWPYVITVRAKSNEVDTDDDDNQMEMWSKPSMKILRTLSRKPDKAPEVPVGSFYIDNTETQLRLYWKKMELFEQNGPGFHYIIRELDNANQTITENKTNATTITYLWKSEQEKSRLFKISSANDEGESDNYNILRIHFNNELIEHKNQYILDEKSIAKIYHNNTYTLSWMPPRNVNQMLNYTVFWCLPKIELPNQCKGTIYYKYVDKTARNFVTEPQEADRSLNLAISANYPDFTNGMQWAQCSGDASSELMKMEIDVTPLNESSILIKWNTGSVCASILKGYNLSYWLPKDNENENHTNIIYHTLQLNSAERNYTITNLIPYTEICVYMSMYSATKRGGRSDTKCLKTKEGAPSAPRNLMSGNVTSKSADIIWETPLISNGILTKYTIYWRKSSSDIFDKTSIFINRTSYTLTSLNSYTSYEIYVTAETSRESIPSNRINVSTLIGIPSNPRNITITGDENESTIAWEIPLLPSGRLDFYVVALVRCYNDGEEITESVSLVKDHRCHFRTLECDNNYYSYKFKVRAVNVASIQEYDHDITPSTPNLTIAYGHIDQNFCRPHKNDVKLKFPYSLLLWRNAAITSNEILQQQQQQQQQKAIFASPWSYSFQEYKCLGTNLFTYMTAIIMLGFIMVALISYWLRSKYREMKNIEVILPDGLIDQVSKYKLAQNNQHLQQHQQQHSINVNDEFEIETKKSSQFDMSCNSKDCLLNFDCNKMNQVLATLTPTSTPKNVKHHEHILNMYDQSTSNEQKGKYDIEKEDKLSTKDEYHEHSSLATTNDELSSNSSSQSNYRNNNDYVHNKSISFYNNNNKPQYESTTSEEEEEAKLSANRKNNKSQNNDDFVDHKTDCQQVPFNNSVNGYVTPNDLLLASTNINCVSQPLPKLNLTNGYIQASMIKHISPKKMIIDDDNYTKVEDLDNILKQKISATNVPSNKLLNSQLITQTQQEKSHMNNVGFQSNYENDELTSTKASLHENYNNCHNNNISNSCNNTNNNNDHGRQTICGYVTRQQLANYGTSRMEEGN